MDKKTTIYDIAQACGVSITTVSLVLNNRVGIAQETRTKVLETASKLGYLTKPAAPTHRCGKLSKLGLIIKAEPNLSPQANPFYSKVIWGVEEACRHNSISMLFAMLPVDENNHPLEIPTLLNSEEVDGLLMVGAFVDKTILSVNSLRDIPIILVDSYSDTEKYDTLVSDNFRAAYQAVEYLIKKGHRHIAMVGSEPNAYPSFKDRRNGYLRALKENDISTNYMANFNLNSKDKQAGHDEIARLLKENAQITAVFGVNDDAAVMALHTAKNMGLRVPEDISIVGYDDTYLAINASPMLTTLHVDTAGMGRAAVQMLAFRLENPDTARMTLTIHPYLVERNSVVER